MGDSAAMRFHRHEHVEVEAPSQPVSAQPFEAQPFAAQPMAAAIWQDGLAHAAPAGGLVIHAPHASDLLAAPKTSHRDAA